MEGFAIFLLFVIIILLIIFAAVRNAKFKRLDEKLSYIEKHLKNLQANQNQQSTVSKMETVVPTVQKPIIPVQPVVVPPKVEPVIPVEEKKPEPFKEEGKAHVIVPPAIPIVQQTQRTDQSSPPVYKHVVPQESWYDRFRKNNPDWEKFIGENILSKVAITVLVIGIAFFVKYAIDKNWINEIARVAIGILCGGIVLGFAHRLRAKFKAFSSVLVAGGISIFYFTIGIAFHQYHIFNQTTAFVIMLLITGFSVFISVVYDRVELAALSIIGGFATPFMVSTGQGNYIVLFSYVLILDAGMLVLAYLRKWNLINVLAYVFTMLLYFGWLQIKVTGQLHAPYKGAIVFGAVFYVLFIVMNIIHNLKEKKKFGVLDLSILISNTFIFYGVGMQILSYWHPELKGTFSGLLAGFNLACSWLLYKKFKADTKLVYLMIGLTLTFVTLIAPVQLHGNYITIFWALESVLLIWLAQKSGIVMYRLASVIITFLMGISLLMDWVEVYDSYTLTGTPILINKAFVTGLISSLSLLGVALLLKKEHDTVSYLGIPFNPKAYSMVLAILFIVLLYFTGILELGFQAGNRIYGVPGVIILIGMYHFLFFAALNLFSKSSVSKGVQITKYVLNFFNAFIFVVFFALIPIADFKENFTLEQRAYVGFIAHYISIAAVVFAIYSMYKAIRAEQSPIYNTKILNTVLLSFATTYVFSSELVLHVLQLLVHPISSSGDLDYYTKYAEYDRTKSHVFKIGFPILWGLLSFAYLWLGMKKQNKTLRIVALVLIGITLFKLFVFDIKEASEAGKIIAFIILGIVLLIISFMYQKIKALLLDDDKKEKTESTN